MTDPSLEEWVQHPTRLTRRNRRALELLAMSGGHKLQVLTNDAVTDYLRRHYPELLAAIGDEKRERRAAARLLDGQD